MPCGHPRFCVFASALAVARWPCAAGLMVERDVSKALGLGIGNVRELSRYEDLDLPWDEGGPEEEGKPAGPGVYPADLFKDRLRAPLELRRAPGEWSSQPRVEVVHRHVLHHALQVLPILVVILLAAVKWREMRTNMGGPVQMGRIVEFVCSITLFMVSGPCVILLNKHIIRDYKFHFPILLASLGSFLNMAATRGAVATGARKLETQSVGWRQYLRVIVPICIFNFSTQVMGMWAYLFIPVPEIQILKSITVVLTLALAICVVREKTSTYLVCGVLVITAGTATAAVCTSGCSVAGVAGRGQAIGILLCLSASGFEGAKTVVSQVLMDKMSVFDGLYWSCPTFVVFALVFICTIELRHLVHTTFTWPLIGVLICNALLTGLTVLSNFWFVKLVGALTLKVLTQARTLGLILSAVFFFGETCTDLQFVGYTITLVGMGVFNDAKQRMNAKAEK